MTFYILDEVYKSYSYDTSLPFFCRLQSNLNSSNTDGSFTMANSNSFLSSYEIPSMAKENKYLGIFSYHEILFVYSLELPHRGDSNVYTHHTIIV